MNDLVENELETVFVHPRRFTLSPSLRGKIRALSRLRTSRGFLAIGCDWLVILACFLLAIWWPHWLTWLAAGIVIATRQHALGVLMHDAAHFRLSRSHAWNDRWSNWLLAYPLLTTT